MKLLHITIQTKYFEEEITFFQEHVGLTIQQDMREKGKNLVFLAAGPEDTKIEIIENPEVDHSGSEYVSIGFPTKDLEGKRDSLIEAGFDVAPVISPMPGVQFFAKDPAEISCSLWRNNTFAHNILAAEKRWRTEKC